METNQKTDKGSWLALSLALMSAPLSMSVLPICPVATCQSIETASQRVCITLTWPFDAA